MVSITFKNLLSGENLKKPYTVNPDPVHKNSTVIKVSNLKNHIVLCYRQQEFESQETVTQNQKSIQHESSGKVVEDDHVIYNSTVSYDIVEIFKDTTQQGQDDQDNTHPNVIGGNTANDIPYDRAENQITDSSQKLNDDDIIDIDIQSEKFQEGPFQSNCYYFLIRPKDFDPHQDVHFIAHKQVHNVMFHTEFMWRYQDKKILSNNFGIESIYEFAAHLLVEAGRRCKKDVTATNPSQYQNQASAQETVDDDKDSKLNDIKRVTDQLKLQNVNEFQSSVNSSSLPNQPQIQTDPNREPNRLLLCTDCPLKLYQYDNHTNTSANLHLRNLPTVGNDLTMKLWLRHVMFNLNIGGDPEATSTSASSIKSESDPTTVTTTQDIEINVSQAVPTVREESDKYLGCECLRNNADHTSLNPTLNEKHRIIQNMNSIMGISFNGTVDEKVMPKIKLFYYQNYDGPQIRDYWIGFEDSDGLYHVISRASWSIRAVIGRY